MRTICMGTITGIYHKGGGHMIQMWACEFLYLHVAITNWDAQQISNGIPSVPYSKRGISQGSNETYNWNTWALSNKHGNILRISWDLKPT